MKKSTIRLMSLMVTILMCALCLTFPVCAAGEVIDFVSPSRNGMVFARGYELWPTLKVTALGGGIDEITVTLSGEGITGAATLGTVSGAFAEYVVSSTSTPDSNGYQLANLPVGFELTGGTGKYLLKKSGEYTLTAQAKSGGFDVGEPVVRTFTVQKYAKNTPWALDWEDYENVDTYDSISPFMRSETFRNTFPNLSGSTYSLSNFSDKGKYIQDVVNSSSITENINAGQPYYGTDTTNKFNLGNYLLNFHRDSSITGTNQTKYYTYRTRSDAAAERIYGTNTNWTPTNNQFIAPGQRLVFEGDFYTSDYDQKIIPLIITNNVSTGSETSTNYGYTPLLSFRSNGITTFAGSRDIQVAVPKTLTSGETQIVAGYFEDMWYHWRYELDTVNKVVDVYITGDIYIDNDKSNTYNEEIDTLLTGTTRILAQKEFNWADSGAYAPKFDEAGIRRICIYVQGKDSTAQNTYMDNFTISYLSEDNTPDPEEPDDPVFEITAAEITEAADNQSVTGSVSFNNTLYPSGGKCIMLLGLYDGNRLVDLEILDKTIAGNESSETISLTRDLEKAYTGAKLFVWSGDDIAKLIPMTSEILPVNETLNWTAAELD